MMNKQEAIEMLAEIADEIAQDGAINLASARNNLRKYRWFSDINATLPLDEQNKVIRERLAAAAQLD